MKILLPDPISIKSNWIIQELFLSMGGNAETKPRIWPIPHTPPVSDTARQGRHHRQSNDDTLRKMADRIQARAIRRCGELLKQYDGRGRPSENSVGTHTISQADIADDAGLSRHQRVTAVRVANVSQDEFDAAVEGDAPPTVTTLAQTVARSLVNQEARGPARVLRDRLRYASA